MPTFYFWVDVNCQIEARVQDFEAVPISTAVEEGLLVNFWKSSLKQS
jgi:hypothetical protein